jgi:hypothetical protein
MTDYEIQGPTKVCVATGRELKPGDRFHAMLVEQSGKLVRLDYSAEAWSGPVADAIAHWSGHVPSSDKPRKPVVNDDMLLDCFDRLKDSTDPDGMNFRYVVALLLMRRKQFRFEDAFRDPNGHDVLLLRDTRNKTVHQVADTRLSDEQIAVVQSEVFRVLGWD